MLIVNLLCAHPRCWEASEGGPPTANKLQGLRPGAAEKPLPSWQRLLFYSITRACLFVAVFLYSLMESTFASPALISAN
jgi:hypothetical protein